MAASARTDPAAVRAMIEERFSRKLDAYLPRSGPLRPWTLARIEEALARDMNEIARDVIESRMAADPERVVGEEFRCPDCGRAMGGVERERGSHRRTIFGPVRFARSVGYCPACGRAFSPSGLVVGLRRGLL